MKKTYLVTGGAGFIGSHIVDKLIELNYDVIVIDNLSTGKKENINKNAKFIYLDLSQATQEEINKYLINISAVFHCAALPNVQYSMDYPLEASKANVDSCLRILEAMKQNKVPKIIYSSSCSVYGNASALPTEENSSISPLSPYALHKYIGEEYCYLYHQIYNIQYVILRYFNVYGERMTNQGAYMSVLNHFIKCYHNNEPLNIVNDGKQKRDFVYVKDVAEANAASIDNKIQNQIFNIGSGANYSINTIADWFGLEKKYGEKRIEPFETLSSINKAKNILGWQPKKELEFWINNQLKGI